MASFGIFGAGGPFRLIGRTMDMCREMDTVLQSIKDGLGYAPGIDSKRYEQICMDLKRRGLITCELTKMGVIGEALTLQGEMHLARGGDVAELQLALAEKAINVLKP